MLPQIARIHADIFQKLFNRKGSEARRKGQRKMPQIAHLPASAWASLRRQAGIHADLFKPQRHGGAKKGAENVAADCAGSRRFTQIYFLRFLNRKGTEARRRG